MLAARFVTALPLVCLQRYCGGLLLPRGNGVDVSSRSIMVLDVLTTMANHRYIFRKKNNFYSW